MPEIVKAKAVAIRYLDPCSFSGARVPYVYQQAVFKMTEAVTCTKCKHQHLLEPPPVEISVAELEDVEGFGGGRVIVTILIFRFG